MLREALALWRGPPLDELAGYFPAEAEAARLTELRRLASEDLMDADLACGRHTRASPSWSRWSLPSRCASGAGRC